MGHNSINLINKEDIQPSSAKNRIHFQLNLLIFYNNVEYSDSVLNPNLVGDCDMGQCYNIAWQDFALHTGLNYQKKTSGNVKKVRGI